MNPEKIRKNVEDFVKSHVPTDVKVELEYQQVLNWRDIFDNATVSEKKTILCQLIDRIEVDRNYQITIFLKGTKNDFLVA